MSQLVRQNIVGPGPGFFETQTIIYMFYGVMGSWFCLAMCVYTEIHHCSFIQNTFDRVFEQIFSFGHGFCNLKF